MPARKIENLTKAAASLERGLADPIVDERDLAGIVKMFEMTYELAWKSLKAVLESQGNMTQGSRDVFRKAWQLRILNVATEKTWMDMIEERNDTVHTYNEALAREMVERIRATHAPALSALTRDLARQISLPV